MIMSHGDKGLSSSLNKPRIMYVLSYASGLSLFAFINNHLKELGMSGSQIGYISSLIPLVMLFCLLYGVWLLIVTDEYMKEHENYQHNLLRPE